MLSRRLFLLLCALCALLPLVRSGSASPAPETPFPGWPSHFEGRPLTPLPLSELEASFQQGFPGQVGRFSDGRREIILRWVTRETRKLHPSADCFKANGYQLENRPLLRQGEQRWSSYLASRKGTRLLVRERISDAGGGQWSDVSAWYWAAQLGQTQGPWWAVTVAEPEQE